MKMATLLHLASTALGLDQNVILRSFEDKLRGRICLFTRRRKADASLLLSMTAA